MKARIVRHRRFLILWFLTTVLLESVGFGVRHDAAILRVAYMLLALGLVFAIWWSDQRRHGFAAWTTRHTLTTRGRYDQLRFDGRFFGLYFSFPLQRKDQRKDGLTASERALYGGKRG